MPKDGIRRGGPGRPKGRANNLTLDLRETIRQAFYGAGGRQYLIQVARKRPDVFLALVGKIIPAETTVTLQAAYQAMPIPVEARDALPSPEASRDVLGAVYDAIGAADPAIPPPIDPSPQDAGEWL